MERSSDVSLAVDRCRKKARAAVDMDRLQCALPRARVVEHHYMRKVPSDWRDSRGAAYRVLGGRYFEHAAGSGIGFDLGPNRPKVPLGTVVLTSERHVRFADRRVLEAKVWRRWPELAQELSAWRKSESGKCTDASTCMAKSAYASHLRGVALEYTLQDGRRLQFLRAESRPVDGNNRLLVRLWRTVEADGRTNVLQDRQEWLSGVTTEGLDCQSQCHWNWDAGPELFTAAGRTFVFGAYSGGTVSGYMFVEVLPRQVKLLGWYRWGS